MSQNIGRRRPKATTTHKFIIPEISSIFLISNQIFSVKQRVSNRIFSAKRQTFKPNIFGQAPDFPTEYFRPSTEFPIIPSVATTQIQINIFHYIPLYSIIFYNPRSNGLLRHHRNVAPVRHSNPLYIPDDSRTHLQNPRV